MSFANDTPASTLCLLSGLTDKKPEAKVRFLGCVASYDSATGVLTLEQPMTGTPTRVKALVSLNMILDRITAEQVATGAWINVIGRVENSTHETQMQTQTYLQRHADAQSVRVQALLVWSTGPIDFRAYEKEVLGLLREDGGSEVPDQAMADR
ncbi:hypothetical protein F503_02236 [Ophiostoma piceae UAMH 11346]|uniref:Uncharacterized protein n=1 Tax=Ophiostoma piceae (strain UAMH 11346) TaxID=1262450 RepID=S3BY73_OPHP1|nr:hypothetical protein F503_02236 [Ophiostoma piceae UAMH 11346]